MTAVERVEELAKNERQLTWIESRYWANQYLMLLRELAIELDAARMQLYTMQYGNHPLGKIVAPYDLSIPITPDEPKLSKSEATSKRMREWWAEKKAREAK